MLFSRRLLTLGWVALIIVACNGEIGDAAQDSSAPAAAKSATLPPEVQSAGVVLQYHHVDARTPAITSTRPEEFEAHLAWLEQQDFEIWPLEKLVEHLQEGAPTPPLVAAITFDDAYQSIYTTAMPMLERRGWPFTVFVATEPVEQRKQGFLTWDELREMQSRGATIANHTHTHAHLLRRQPDEPKAAWLERVAGELIRAQTLLETNLGEVPHLFAYPYGEYDPDVLDVVERLGFVGFGQQSGAVGAHMNFTILPRFPFGGVYNDLEQFKTKVKTLPMPVETPLLDPVVGDDLTPTLTLTFLRDDLPLHNLACYVPGGGRATLERNGREVTVTTPVEVPVGRSRFNCTMPSGVDNRFYWFSQLWIRKRDDGSWYPEP